VERRSGRDAILAFHNERIGCWGVLTNRMTYYFTFGSNHLDRDGSSLGRSYAAIEADDEPSARALMHDIRGGSWCTSYLSPEEAGVEKWGLSEVSIEQLDNREQRKEEELEAIVADRRKQLQERISKLDEIKEVMRKLPVHIISKCREYDGQLDIDTLTREEVVTALSSLGAGRWSKSVNTAYDAALDYHGEVNGIKVRLWAAGAPESCRVVEVEETIPEQKVIRRKLVCTPE